MANIKKHTYLLKCCLSNEYDVMFVLLNLLMQSQRGFLTARVEGKTHDFIVTTRDDVWRKRRRILSPAFSAHKMKLVIFT